MWGTYIVFTLPAIVLFAMIVVPICWADSWVKIVAKSYDLRALGQGFLLLWDNVGSPVVVLLWGEDLKTNEKLRGRKECQIALSMGSLSLVSFALISSSSPHLKGGWPAKNWQNLLLLTCEVSSREWSPLVLAPAPTNNQSNTSLLFLFYILHPSSSSSWPLSPSSSFPTVFFFRYLRHLFSSPPASYIQPDFT